MPTEHDLEVAVEEVILGLNDAVAASFIQIAFSGRMDQHVVVVAATNDQLGSVMTASAADLFECETLLGHISAMVTVIGVAGAAQLLATVAPAIAQSLAEPFPEDGHGRLLVFAFDQIAYRPIPLGDCFVTKVKSKEN